MIRRIHFIACIFALLVGCSPKQPTELNGVPKRIISFAPGITETLYALELGHKVVGATTYCLYPEEAKALPRVGGFGQYNFEAIVALKPDLVILHRGQEAEKLRLDGLGIPYIDVETRRMNDILESIKTIGTACGANEEAQILLDDMHKQMAALIQNSGKHPRVLITFGINLDQIHAFGTDCLHHDLLERAGGINVIEQNLPFSTLSKEAVIRLNPDIIIQLSPGTEPSDDRSKPWKQFASVEAVKNNQIHVLTGDYTCIPGPRFLQILKDFDTITQQ